MKSKPNENFVFFNSHATIYLKDHHLFESQFPIYFLLNQFPVFAHVPINYELLMNLAVEVNGQVGNKTIIS